MPVPLIPLLDPFPGYLPLLDAGASRWTRLRVFPQFWTPVHPYHTVGPFSERLPTFGRRRTLITTLDPSLSVSPLLDTDAPLSHRWSRFQGFHHFRTPAPLGCAVGPVPRFSPTFGRRRTSAAKVDPLSPLPDAGPALQRHPSSVSFFAFLAAPLRHKEILTISLLL
ncbi:hypothetical protein Y032_0004g2105 [Ancylostoma ceylanicum]|uniref:Uncharacterized protein n=1 Tax=Ancylostoma ceylanicum TaxID=53326 RepID=A0A016VVI2_9BILA|nr:hypothetical protein Y032_0004g2105 [Ancylostoma ceylanicum]